MITVQINAITREQKIISAHPDPRDKKATDALATILAEWMFENMLAKQKES